ncbi:MAG: DNA polymerase III subunit delta [Gammaproteobacteria bacterium]
MSQLRPEQLAAELQRGLTAVYFIHGDETLLVNECADAVRAAARARGFTERQVFSVDSGFDWNSLRAACDSLSLFSEKRLLELRLPTGKPGREGVAALRDYAARPPEDRLLLILSARLEPAARRSKWVQALDEAGVCVAVWPVEVSRLPAWIERRMSRHGMRAERDALQLLAERVEGNLLAAAQEIEKLYLLHGPGVLDLETVTELVMDSARYDVFGLVDRALAGEVVAVQRVLAGLRAEGIEPVLVLWALAREIRVLAVMAAELDRGTAPGQVLARHRVWEKRKPLIGRVLQRVPAQRWRDWLQRCAGIDRVIKGRSAGSCWDELLQLSLELAGLVPVSESA